MRRISTSNSRSRAGSSAMSDSPPASTLRSSSFACAARIESALANSPRSVASETSRGLTMSPKPISSIRFLGEQRHQRRNDPFALGAAGRREGGFWFCTAERCGLAGHGGLLSLPLTQQ
jgi:hypothetical protein